MSKNEFGYPNECKKCQDIAGGKACLQARPYFNAGGGPRLMLIGQDPTIKKNPDRVQQVLMLDEENGQIYRWLQDLFGGDLTRLTLYASNTVKCRLPGVPGSYEFGAISYLSPFFEQCKHYLIEEVARFRPELVITFGEAAHQLFITLAEPQSSKPPKEMIRAFTGDFTPMTVAGVKFRYSPCLHITTFRVAETYGTAVQRFRHGLPEALGAEPVADLPKSTG